MQYVKGQRMHLVRITKKGVCLSNDRDRNVAYREREHQNGGQTCITNSWSTKFTLPLILLEFIEVV